MKDKHIFFIILGIAFLVGIAIIGLQELAIENIDGIFVWKNITFEYDYTKDFALYNNNGGTEMHSFSGEDSGSLIVESSGSKSQETKIANILSRINSKDFNIRNYEKIIFIVEFDISVKDKWGNGGSRINLGLVDSFGVEKVLVSQGSGDLNIAGKVIIEKEDDNNLIVFIPGKGYERINIEDLNDEINIYFTSNSGFSYSQPGSTKSIGKIEDIELIEKVDVCELEVCGNDICNPNCENKSTCSEDCGVINPCDNEICGNDICNKDCGETRDTCPQDCMGEFPIIIPIIIGGIIITGGLIYMFRKKLFNL